MKKVQAAFEGTEAVTGSLHHVCRRYDAFAQKDEAWPGRTGVREAEYSRENAMKRFFIRQILPPVLIQLSIIAVLAYYEGKNFVPFVAPDEFGADFLSVFVLIPTVLLTWLWQAVAAVRYLMQAPKPRGKAAVLLMAWLLAYPLVLMAAVILAWWVFLSLFR